jgi:SPP1 gp7 family putative phage head morphogenesis protein
VSSLRNRLRLKRQALAREKVLPPVRANAGIEAKYRRMLFKMVDAMHESVVYWVESAYRNNEPEMALDESPAAALNSAVKKLTRRWQRNFNRASKRMADYFSEDVSERTDGVLRRILADSGWSVDFKMTPAMNDVFAATVNENVSLIKSIPQRYLSQVEGMVARSVSTGRDLGQLSKDLQEQLGVTKRRAALIARDQNAKATSAFTRVRQTELGIEEAIWVHSSAGKVPRPTHVKNDGKKYRVSEGWLDPAVDKRIFPGELINCRCFSRSVIPGFS